MVGVYAALAHSGFDLPSVLVTPSAGAPSACAARRTLVLVTSVTILRHLRRHLPVRGLGGDVQAPCAPAWRSPCAARRIEVARYLADRL